MTAAHLDRLARAMGSPIVAIQPLQRASTVDVYAVDLADGAALVAKAGDGHQSVEAAMLADLWAEGTLPVPQVRLAEADLLVLDRVEQDGRPPDAQAQRHLAALLATLHATPHARFGWHYDTTIGQLPQPNRPEEDWIAFFRDRRLLHMADAAFAEGTVDSALHGRLHRLADRLDRYLVPPAYPSLLHGDLWTGNILCREGRIVGIIDPALYCGHPEIELAFMTLFGTVGPDFFAAYAERAPYDPDFLDLRRDLYNIYPLLVHVRYWDRAYARGIDAALRRVGL